MRLTCPNCGAQYEVPDEVIPTEGRDVQCSNCGNTWFQTHPNHIQPEAEETAPRPETGDLRAAFRDEPAPEPEAETPQPAPAPRAEVDPSVADILRKEAQHEAELRAAETGAALESQPDLGLDNAPDDAERRAREARNRMAMMRGEAPEPSPEDAAAAGSRRDLLPDIEEINSSLRSNTEKSPSRGAVSQVAEQPQQSATRSSGGFTRGFAISLIVVVALVLVYVNAPDIARSVPQADPALSAYVGGIDQLRTWLDAQLGTVLPR